MMDQSDTICALSTPPGRSGIAVIRLSGPQSRTILSKLFLSSSRSREISPRRATLGRIVASSDGTDIDEAVAVLFPAPGSYTREDMVEISLHGSPVLIAALLDSVCSLGARLAKPGEFTMRAFLNGRIDLTQAEAVHDIIEATTLYQARVAARQCGGSLAQSIRPIKETVVDVIATLESAVEFVEEDLNLASRGELVQQLDQILEQLNGWIDSYRRGKVIKEGFSMAVVGRPNVGKSSVFNALLAQNRSIVAEIPGTTRDLISEFTNLNGIPVRLQDTAGIHDSEDQIEQLGVERSLQAIADADAVLFVTDTSVPISQHDLVFKNKIGHLPCIVVMNKSDLPSAWTPSEKQKFMDTHEEFMDTHEEFMDTHGISSAGHSCIEVSAKTGYGIADLRTTILNRILGEGGLRQDGILVTNLRHYHSLKAAEKCFEKALSALKEGLSEEFALVDLHSGLRELGALTGETAVEDILTEIFSRFCVGK
jgi:tRNA modification GTPase